MAQEYLKQLKIDREIAISNLATEKKKSQKNKDLERIYDLESMIGNLDAEIAELSKMLS